MKGEVECLIIDNSVMVKIRLYKQIRDSDSGAFVNDLRFTYSFTKRKKYIEEINGGSSH